MIGIPDGLSWVLVVVYVVWVLLPAAIVLGRFAATGPAGIASYRQLPTPYHVAYLMQGARQVVHAAIASLVAAGCLRISPLGLLEPAERDRATAGLSAIEISVLDLLRAQPKAQVYAIEPELQRVGAPFTAEFVALGLAIEPRRIAALRRWTLLGYLPLFALSLCCVLFARSDGTISTPEYLVSSVFSLLALGVLGWLSPTRLWLTDAGRWLRDLAKATRNHPDGVAYARRSAAHAVALGGFAAYPHEEIRTLLVRSSNEPGP